MTSSTRLFLVLYLVLSLTGFAQDRDNLSEDINVDELGNNTDEFQELFFKAIAQRAVENPEKAIEELERCLELEPQKTAVFYELAKNYIDLKDFEKAEDFIIKTLSDSSYKGNVNIHKQLFYVYSMQKRYDEAIEEARFISESDPVYFQELSDLYFLKKDYELALEALDQFDAVEGIDDYRDEYRMLIYKEGELLDEGIRFFNKRFQNSVEDGKAATSLMELYRLNNSPQKAIDVGKTLEDFSPNSPQLYVEMALANLVNKTISEAEYYSKKVVESPTINEKDKVKVIKTFKALALQNPKAQSAFENVLDSALTSEKKSSSKAELGEFYKSRDKVKALENFKSASRNNPNDFKLIKNILELEFQLENYEDIIKTSDGALESFPSQALLYYAKGYALSQLGQDKEAVGVLEEALDYIFDDDRLKAEVLKALKNSYSALGETEKADAYEQKIIQISN